MSEPITIKLCRLENGVGLPLPEYQTADSAGMDLYAAVGEPLTMMPLDRVAVPCGFAMALPGEDAGGGMRRRFGRGRGWR